MNIATLGRFGLTTFFFTAVFIHVMTTASMGAGYEAATNESVGFTDGYENVTSIDDEVRESIHEDTTAVQRAPAKPYLELFYAAMTVTSGPSYRFGFKHPGAAEKYIESSPFVIGFGIALFAYGEYRNFRKNVAT